MLSMKKATSEERLIWRLLDLEKELRIGFAKLNIKFDKIDAIEKYLGI